MSEIYIIIRRITRIFFKKNVQLRIVDIIIDTSNVKLFEYIQLFDCYLFFVCSLLLISDTRISNSKNECECEELVLMTKTRKYFMSDTRIELNYKCVMKWFNETTKKEK